MHFVIFSTDKPGMLALREATREAHRAYIRAPSVPVRMIHGGPTLDPATGSMNGTLLIVEADDMEAVRAFVASDPYSKADLFASVEIRPWRWGFGAPTSSL